MNATTTIPSTTKIFEQVLKNKKRKIKKLDPKELVKLANQSTYLSRNLHEFLSNVFGYEPGNDSYGKDCPAELCNMSVGLTAMALVFEAIANELNGVEKRAN